MFIDWSVDRPVVGGVGSQVRRGSAVRERVMDAAVAQIRRHGIGSLSMRGVAEATAVALSTIQFHFGDQGEFVREAIGCWANDVTRLLTAAVGESRGLARTAMLCVTWSSLPDSLLVSAEGMRIQASTSGRDGASGMLIRALEEWLDLTHRSLQQAKLKKELVAGCDLHALALELHCLLWSSGWLRGLRGAEEARRAILQAVWARLGAVAARPEVLGPLDPFLAVREHEEPQGQTMSGAIKSPPPPTWRVLLSPEDPLYHAFERHELMGDARTFLNPPEVLPEDVSTAEGVPS